MQRLLRLSCGLLVCSGIASCGQPALARDAALGQGLASRFSMGADTALVLVLDPGDVFACRSAISEWQTYAATSSSRAIAVVLTRQPTGREARELVATRLHADSILPPGNEGDATPQLLIAHRGMLLAKAEGQARLTQLADSLIRGFRPRS